MADIFRFKIIIALRMLVFQGNQQMAVTNYLLKFDEIENFDEKGKIMQ
ncbi:MAG TPA: hypothetical protein VLZ83_06205 [Edaphocola sp.]|nr:hypothetical protein [Edaphocola sp.]